MRTTIEIDDKLLAEAKKLSGTHTKKRIVEMALKEFIRIRKAKKLIRLEGKIDLSYNLDELLERRKSDVPD